jgi:hypothetical protein
MSGPAHETTTLGRIARGVDRVAQPAAVLATGVVGAAAAAEVVSGGATTPLSVAAAGIGSNVAAVAGTWNGGRAAYELYNRYQHDRSLSFSDPQARAAYFNLAGGGAAGIGKIARTLGATRVANVANAVLNGTNTASQVAQLHQDWNSLTPEEQASRSADLLSDQGLLNHSGNRATGPNTGRLPEPTQGAIPVT